MRASRVIGLTSVGILLTVWLASALSIWVAMRRGARAAAPALGPTERPTLQLRTLPTVFLFATMATVNLLWFVPAWCWYRIRRSPIPAPGLGTRGDPDEP